VRRPIVEARAGRRSVGEELEKLVEKLVELGCRRLGPATLVCSENDEEEVRSALRDWPFGAAIERERGALRVSIRCFPP